MRAGCTVCRESTWEGGNYNKIPVTAYVGHCLHRLIYATLGTVVNIKSSNIIWTSEMKLQDFQKC